MIEVKITADSKEKFVFKFDNVEKFDDWLANNNIHNKYISYRSFLNDSEGEIKRIIFDGNIDFKEFPNHSLAILRHCDLQFKSGSSVKNYGINNAFHGKLIAKSVTFKNTYKLTSVNMTGTARTKDCVFDGVLSMETEYDSKGDSAPFSGKSLSGATFTNIERCLLHIQGTMENTEMTVSNFGRLVNTISYVGDYQFVNCGLHNFSDVELGFDDTTKMSTNLTITDANTIRLRANNIKDSYFEAQIISSDIGSDDLNNTYVVKNGEFNSEPTISLYPQLGRDIIKNNSKIKIKTDSVVFSSRPPFVEGFDRITALLISLDFAHDEQSKQKMLDGAIGEGSEILKLDFFRDAMANTDNTMGLVTRMISLKKFLKFLGITDFMEWVKGAKND